MKRIFFSLIFNLIIVTATAQEHFRILVFDFETIGTNFNLTDSKVFANSLRVELSRQNTSININILEREDFSKIFIDRSKAENLNEMFDEKSAIEIGKLLEANFVVFGKLSKSTLFPGIKISIRVVNVETGTIPFAEEIDYNEVLGYESSIQYIASEIIHSINEINKPVLLKNKDLFIRSVEDLFWRYSYNDRSFISINSVADVNDKNISKFLIQANPRARAMGYFAEWTYIPIKGNKSKRKTTPQYTVNSLILFDEDGIHYYYTLKNEADSDLHSKSVSSIVVSSILWPDFYNSSLSYDLINEPNKVTIGMNSISFYDSVIAGRIMLFLKQIKHLVEKNKFFD